MEQDTNAGQQALGTSLGITEQSFDMLVAMRSVSTGKESTLKILMKVAFP